MDSCKEDMNILFFSRLFYPHIGGVEKHVLEVGRLLIKKGHKVTIITEQDLLKTKPSETIEKIDIFRIPGLKNGKFKKFKIWKWLWNNYDLMENADIVHCHDVFFWYLPFRFLLPFKKVFTTFHGYEGYPLKKKDVLIRKISAKLSDGNICIGDFIKKWYGTKPTYVSYGGVKIPDSKLRNLDKDSQYTALFVGRLNRETGISIYIEAYKIIMKEKSKFKLTVIGDGFFRHKIPKNIEVLGFKKDPEKYFANRNLAFVSGYLSILEAMAAKRLVFAVYDNPVKEDYLKMSPFSKYIIISNSPSDLVSKIYYYLGNSKKKEELIEKAYGWVKKHTWKEMANMYLKLWGI